MFSRKILLIIAAVFVLLALSLYFFGRKKPSRTATTTPDQQSEVSSSLIPSLNQGLITVPVRASDEDIQKAFSEFTSKKPTKPLESSKITDSKNKPLSLDKFTQAVGVKLKPQLRGLLDTSDYELFVCNDAGKADYGIIITVRLLPDYGGNLYQDELKFMRAWESSLFKDTAKIIFPNFNFTEEQLGQTVIFEDGTCRYANVVLPDNTSGSINYDLVDDYVIISSSKDCLGKASEYVFSSD